MNTVTTTTSQASVTFKDGNHTLQEMPVFDEAKMIKVLVLGTLFFVSLFGNLATLIQMYKMRKRRSTINTLIINLATADLLVTFFCMGADAVWAATVQWYAGEFMCRFVKFAQVFANNLSTYVTVVISLDRCCVILYPMSRNKAPKRVRNMIICSWCLGALFSIPQNTLADLKGPKGKYVFLPFVFEKLIFRSVSTAALSFLILIGSSSFLAETTIISRLLIFQVKEGPWEVRFVQCMEDYGPARQWGKKAYNIVSVLFSFVVPLLMMGTAYGLISGTIARKMRDFRDQEMSSSSTDTYSFKGQFRSHLFRKAKRKALRMSIVIVAAFIVCWTPYFVLFTCFTFLNIREMPQNTMLYLSFIGLSNSLLNPMIYGAFHLCSVHTPRPERQRAFHRKDWPSFSLKKAEQQQQQQEQQVSNPSLDHEESDIDNDGNCAIICHKPNFVVVCPHGDQHCKKLSVNPCLYVLYKVDGEENNVQTDSVSSV